MILVLFFIIFLILIFFSYIKIEFQNVYISNIPKFRYDFKIKFGIYILKKVKIFGFEITNEKLKNSKLSNKIKSRIKNQKMDISIPEIIKIIRKLNISLDKFQTRIKLGTEDVILTSIFVGIIASSIGIILGKIIKHYEEKKYKYEISPVYNTKNIFDMELNCIINTKLAHIIYVIYIFSKKRSGNKNERTSNRGAYDYGYE